MKMVLGVMKIMTGVDVMLIKKLLPPLLLEEPPLLLEELLLPEELLLLPEELLLLLEEPLLQMQPTLTSVVVQFLTLVKV